MSVRIAVALLLVASSACRDRDGGDRAGTPAVEATGDTATEAPAPDRDELVPGPSAGPSTILEESALDEAQARAVARGREAQKQLATTLMGELQAALSSGDPAGAIDVCAERAPAIARETAQGRGVAIGRTSFALRNPTNQPPPWAREMVAARRDEPALLALPDGALGMLTPIVLQPQCEICHGAPERLSPAVRDALASRYPDDRATGFSAGDLRGYFWVEVPAGS